MAQATRDYNYGHQNLKVNGTPVYLQTITITGSPTYTAIYPNTNTIPAASGAPGFDPLSTGDYIMLVADTACSIDLGSSTSSNVHLPLQANVPFGYFMASWSPGVTVKGTSGSIYVYVRR